MAQLSLLIGPGLFFIPLYQFQSDCCSVSLFCVAKASTREIYLLISFWQGNFCPGYSRVSYLKPSTDLKPITTSVTSSCRIMLSYRATRTFLCDPELYSQPLFRIGNIGFNHHSKSLGLKKTDFHWSLFNPSSPFPLNLKFHQVLTNDFKDPLHENRRWKKSGIMIPPPRSDLPIEFTRLQKKGIMIPHQTSGYSTLCPNVLAAFCVDEHRGTGLFLNVILSLFDSDYLIILRLVRGRVFDTL
ncbi:hypothetical protein AT2G11626 [Arabidopsis thaliana]|uniref:Uncharacterized protein n=1 Tax=Arabidopsis thaliana TaxID=3702 RepID=F4ISC6_ARATH|nr:uncharacterized protein AT2G11626 [Arabidopsis thaliana]AEC06179.1 hypothetical protein AT2G11626 [Arabidopsis thaliana]|eukprot:NP_671832.1 hypothetical protein AT2G11626 [Arabidopsis thaliana]